MGLYGTLWDMLFGSLIFYNEVGGKFMFNLKFNVMKKAIIIFGLVLFMVLGIGFSFNWTNPDFALSVLGTKAQATGLSICDGGGSACYYKEKVCWLQGGKKCKGNGTDCGIASPCG